MAGLSRRAARRNRHQGNSAQSRSNQTDFATAGEERDLPGQPRRGQERPGATSGDPNRSSAEERSHDPRELNDFDPKYGHTHAENEQPRGTIVRESYGRGGVEGETTGNIQSGSGGGETGFGKEYGQGFGVGAGRGVESSAEGLEGASLREKDYRGLRGSRIGAPVGPDALKEDTSQDKRPDPKPEEGTT